MTKRKQTWLKLKEQLLTLGGDKVDRLRVPELLCPLATCGREFAYAVRLRRGRRHECHRNSAAIWGQDPSRYQLCTGYALSDGRWLEHSWVLEGDCVIETTYRMESYFGVVLSPEEACSVWFWEVLKPCHPGVASLLPAPKSRLDGAGAAPRGGRKKAAA